MARTHHKEWHRSDRIVWLRAAVLGANRYSPACSGTACETC